MSLIKRVLARMHVNDEPNRNPFNDDTTDTFDAINVDVDKKRREAQGLRKHSTTPKNHRMDGNGP
jgi:hypothetical protein